MDMENLVKLKNFITLPEGKLLITYLGDYITDNACKKREPYEIKGMCELLQQIKGIPSEYEKRRK